MVPKNSRNCRGGLLELHEQCRSVGPRAPATGGVCIHAPPLRNPATGGSGSSLFPLLFLAGGEDHRYLQLQKTHNTIHFILFSPSPICSFFFFFGRLLLCWRQIRLLVLSLGLLRGVERTKGRCLWVAAVGDSGGGRWTDRGRRSGRLALVSIRRGGTAVSERGAVFCEVRLERGEAAGFWFQREKEGKSQRREITGDGSTRPEGGRRKKSEAVVCNRGLLWSCLISTSGGCRLGWKIKQRGAAQGVKNENQWERLVSVLFCWREKIQKVGCAEKGNEIGWGVWPWLVFLSGRRKWSVGKEEKSELRGRRLRVKDKKELGLGFFCSFSGVSQNCPPLQNQFSMVFIGKLLLAFSN